MIDEKERERERSLIAFSGYMPVGRQGGPSLFIQSMLVFKSRPEKLIDNNKIHQTPSIYSFEIWEWRAEELS